MAKKIFSFILMLITTLFLTSCGSEELKNQNTNMQEVYNYAEEIENKMLVFSQSLLDLKFDVKSEEEYIANIEAIDNINSSLKKVMDIKAPIGYEDMQKALYKEGELISSFYIIEQQAYKLCLEEYKNEDKVFSEIEDIFFKMTNEAENMELTEEDKEFFEKISLTLKEKPSTNKGYMINFKWLLDLKAPINFAEDFELIKEKIPTLLELDDKYIKTISEQSEIINSKKDDFSKSLISFLNIYSEITQKIDREYPDYYKKRAA